MKIIREENKVIFLPETKWEYQQLTVIKQSRIEVDGFQDDWADEWTSKGGLKIKIKDPYE